VVSYHRSKHFERDKGIFRDYLEGLSFADSARKRGLSLKTPSIQVKKMFAELEGYLLRHVDYPRPKGNERGDHIEQRKYWLELLDLYIEESEGKPRPAMTDSPTHLGLTIGYCERLKTIGVNNIGDLLDTLKDRKAVIIRILAGNMAALDTLERKIEYMGFDPYGGRDQIFTKKA
jgi:hypothetical protein